MKEVEDVETLYNDLMDLVVRLGNAGVIHGDFNEFNIMVTEDAKPILIDFPQMVSTSHVNARMFFERDVNGIREYFRRRFGYESAGFPLFDELIRDDSLDVEVSCSGFTKEMEKELLQEYGMESPSDEEEEDDEDNVNVSGYEKDDEEEELNQMRQQVEEEVKFSEQKPKEKSFNIQNYIASMANTDSPEEVDQFEDAIDDTNPVAVDRAEQISEIEKMRGTLSGTHIGNADSDDDLPDDDQLGELNPSSRQYRLKMVEKILNDAKSHRSYSTTASTIAPDVVKDRIRKNLDFKEKREQRKRCVAKGEANAVTRVRNDNRDTVKQYAGWDF